MSRTDLLRDHHRQMKQSRQQFVNSYKAKTPAQRWSDHMQEVYLKEIRQLLNKRIIRS